MSRLLTAFILLCVTVCPDQQPADMSKCPFAIDPAKIAVDPESKQALPLGWGYTEIGKPVFVDFEVCDKAGYLLEVTVDPKYAATVDVAAGKLTVSYIPTVIGVEYITVSVKNKPVEGQQPATRTGTFALAVLPRNQAPTIGCGVLRK